MPQEWSKNPRGETVWCPLSISATVLLFLEHWGWGSALGWNERRDAFVLEHHLSIWFFYVYKQYLKVKQNQVVKARRVFSPWKMQCSVRLLGKDDFLLWSKWPSFFLCWRALKWEVICIFSGSVHFRKKENYMPEEHSWPVYCLCLPWASKEIHRIWVYYLSLYFLENIKYNVSFHFIMA